MSRPIKAKSPLGVIPEAQNGDGDQQTVYGLIHELHTTITKSIDTSLTWEALNSPPVNYTIVRPIVERLCPRVAENKLKSGLGDRLEVPGNGNGEDTEAASGSAAGVGEDGRGLGMILYALMANRYVSLLFSAS